MSGSAWGFLKDIGCMNIGKARLFRIIFMISGRCPLRCATCGIWKNNDADPDPALDDMETFFNKNRFSWINLTGGEIFLRNDLVAIFQLLAKTQDRLRYVTFPTSGFLTDKTVAGVEAALAAGLPRTHVTVSFDGGRSSHNALRGSKDAFDRAAETFSALRKLAVKSQGRLHVHPGMTLSAELLEKSADPAGDLVRDLRLAGLHEVHMNLAHRSSHYYMNPELKTLSKSRATDQILRIEAARKGAFSALNMAESLYLKGARRYLSTGKPPVSCKACAASVFIDNKWTLFPCTIFQRATGCLKEFQFDLAAATSTQAFLEARDDAASGNCPGCWTPCEAFTALAGNFLKPEFYRLLLS